MDGYAYTKMLKQKIENDANHSLSLQDAVEYLRFYGIRGVFSAQGDIRFVGQVAIDVLDRALSADSCTITWNDDEGTISAHTQRRLSDE